jgi:DNA-binding response OmpR family regulator
MQARRQDKTAGIRSPLPLTATTPNFDLTTPLQSHDNAPILTPYSIRRYGDIMKNRLLIIDDEEGILNALKVGLSRIGYNTDTASDVKAGLKRLAEESYDVVLVDKNMPGSSDTAEGGMEIVRHVGMHLRDTVVMMMTGNATAESARDAMRMGAFDYILKPFRAKDIAEKIERALELMRTLQPARMMDLHKAIRDEVLNVSQKTSRVDSDNIDAILNPVSRILDGIVLLQKEKERIIINQRDALTSIASLAARASEIAHDKTPELASILEKISKTAEIRV